MAKFVCLLITGGVLEFQSAQAQSRRRSSSEQILAKRLMDQGDLNGDEFLDSNEWRGITQQWYNRLDAGGAGSFSREEFLIRMPALLEERGSGTRRSSSMLPSKFLEFFVALDADSDGFLNTKEFEKVTQNWFQEWCLGADSKALNELQIVDGFQKVFPKTNMSGASDVHSQDSIPGLPEPPPSPVLSPQHALQSMQMADGFEMKLAASEPMIQDPVALSFDEDGNLYVVEMRSFMLDMERKGELEPICRISLLKDRDNDGVMDHSSVFLDELVVPRAVLATNGGILFVEDYQLYFAKDTDGDGRADVRELMDADYGRSNIEHASNGLMRAMDNWIYNGRSKWRYRWVKGRLIRERTEIRGQWGMTQDEQGRLFYNVNNSQLLGDFSPPNYMGRNEHYTTTAGLNLFVATDQRVFTSRMNTAVNRGYLPDVLDDAGRLHVFASSCSPVIYRGDQFGPDFIGDAFVCDPAANIIKRNHVFEKGMTLSAQQAYDGYEFLSSTDERFRPVSLHQGPDGCLWVLDMYRGIAQYGMFMTDYLRRESLKRELQKGIHYGRLYRLVNPNEKQRLPLEISDLPGAELVSLLSYSDGWVRDIAQRVIVESGDTLVVPDLIKALKDSDNSLEMIHALWTLEGLFMDLKPTAGTRPNEGAIIDVHSQTDLQAASLPRNVWSACLVLLNHSDSKVKSAAIRVCESLSRNTPHHQTELLAALEKHMGDFDMPVLFQCALTSGNLMMPQALPLMATLAFGHCGEWLIREALMSGLENWEMTFLQMLLSRSDWNTQTPGRVLMLQSLSRAVISEGKSSNVGLLLAAIEWQKGEMDWRGESMLQGVLDQLRSGLDEFMVMYRKPAIWEKLSGHEAIEIRELVDELATFIIWPGHPLYTAPKEIVEETPASAEDSLVLARGEALYQQICAGCHGGEGEGLKAQAPPLRRSDWVTGSSARLIRIVLHGMQGPLQVQGKRYAPPEILAEMPPLSVLEDSQLSSILNFIRREWGHDADWVNADNVEHVRQSTIGRELPWNETELLQIP